MSSTFASGSTPLQQGDPSIDVENKTTAEQEKEANKLGVRAPLIKAGLTKVQVCEQVIAALRGAGFTYVTVDLGAYRSGSMDETLDSPEGPNIS